MSKAAPFRFLAIVLGGWVAVRAALLVPDWSASDGTAAMPRQGSAEGMAIPASPLGPAIPRTQAATRPWVRTASTQAWRVPPSFAAVPVDPPVQAIAPLAPILAAAAGPDPLPGPLPPSGLDLPRPASVPGRWTVSAWTLIRSGDGGQLAVGGTLGGSQAGARITYRLRQGLLLSGRAYAPLRGSGAEAAIGVEWQPLRAVPFRLLAERRLALDEGGRSAFALLAHGGVSDQRVAGRIMLDVYAQAGFVGARSRDAFVDGAARLTSPVGRSLRVGLGGWGAAQPGASRLDVGPHVSYRLPALGEKVRLAADWRLRIAGDARPGSGPALTLSTDF